MCQDEKSGTEPSAPQAPSGQFALLRQRRFAPFFWVQAAGAANDNLLKFAVTVLVTYQLQVAWLPAAYAGLVIGALFIAPYLLFSATAGQLADKLDKRALIVALKDAELLIAAAAGVGLVAQSPAVLLACVFLFGLQSTVFGPVKYGYLPQHLSARELTGGNGMVEMGTFVSILLGNLAGGVLVSLPPDAAVPGAYATAAGCLALALAGAWVARRIPPSPSADPHLRVNRNALGETWNNLRRAYASRAVFRSLLGISWMWLFGSVFLGQFPAFAKDVLGGDAHVASLLLVAFSVGIACGSLLCESLSRQQVEIGLVPVGSVGMSVFALGLYLATRGMQAEPGALQSLSQFLAQPASWRVLADLFALSLSAGLFSVPMYALVQMRAEPTHRSRIIAANNILNALFMVAGAAAAGIALLWGARTQELFAAAALLNVAVALYIFTLVPEYFLRFVAFLVTRLVYRVRFVDMGHIPQQGAALVVANHVSFVDAVVLMAASPRPMRFVMDHRIFATPALGWFFRLARAIPIAPRQEDAQVYERAFELVDQALAQGELVGIFPEGGLTRDGRVQPFKAGVAKILAGREVPVVPVALRGLWGSFFSRAHGSAMSRPFVRGWRSRIEVLAAAPVAAALATPERLQEAVQALLDSPQARR